MFNKSLLFFSLFLVQQSFAQFEFKIDTTTSKCKNEFKKAINDFAKDTYILKIQKSNPFINTQKRVIENMEVRVEFPSVFVEDCYNMKIKTLLNEKFKINFIKYTERKADSLDKIGLGNRNATFFIKEKNLAEFIKENLSSRQIENIKSKYNFILISLQIDSKGVCKVLSIKANTQRKLMIDIKSFRKQLINVKEDVIFEIIDNQKLFFPRTINGESTSSEIAIKINF